MAIDDETGIILIKWRIILISLTAGMAHIRQERQSCEVPAASRKVIGIGPILGGRAVGYSSCEVKNL